MKKRKIFYFNKIDSTNVYAKKLAIDGCDEGVVVSAYEQTKGKGRLGRSFLSRRGGLYFSVVLRPENDVKDTIFITVAAAVAVARAIEQVSGKKCDIKWVNDIYISNKKVCGILTEGGFDTNGKLEYAILGVGINLFEQKEKFPENLPLADHVFHKKDNKIFKNRIKNQLLNKFLDEFFKLYEKIEQKEYIKEYRERSLLTGKEITFTTDGQEQKGSVIGIDDEAKLMVNCRGKTLKLSHGEIQITGMEQLLI